MKHRRILLCVNLVMCLNYVSVLRGMHPGHTPSANYNAQSASSGLHVAAPDRSSSDQHHIDHFVQHAYEGNVPQVKEFIGQFPQYIDAKDAQNRSAFFAAIDGAFANKVGCFEVIEYLLQAGRHIQVTCVKEGVSYPLEEYISDHLSQAIDSGIKQQSTKAARTSEKLSRLVEKHRGAVTVTSMSAPALSQTKTESSFASIGVIQSEPTLYHKTMSEATTKTTQETTPEVSTYTVPHVSHENRYQTSPSRAVAKPLQKPVEQVQERDTDNQWHIPVNTQVNTRSGSPAIKPMARYDIARAKAPSPLRAQNKEDNRAQKGQGADAALIDASNSKLDDSRSTRNHEMIAQSRPDVHTSKPSDHLETNTNAKASPQPQPSIHSASNQSNAASVDRATNRPQGNSVSTLPQSSIIPPSPSITTIPSTPVATTMPSKPAAASSATMHSPLPVTGTSFKKILLSSVIGGGVLTAVIWWVKWGKKSDNKDNKGMNLSTGK